MYKYRFGPRFPAMVSAYDVQLRQLMRHCAKSLNQQQYFKEGVYFYQSGPCFETVAETRMMKILGGDTAGEFAGVDTCLVNTLV